MYIATLIKIFDRDLSKLEKELSLYSDEKNLWELPSGINNTAGNLVLHIVGNLNHFIGAILGNTGYIRERDMEFSQRHIPCTAILKQIQDTKNMVASVLENLSNTDLEKRYPIDVFREPMRTEYFLTHLTTHLSYHLGQINYHRRLLDE